MGRADQDGRGEGGPGRPAPRFHRRGRQQGRGRAGIGIQFQIQIQISSLRCRGSQEDHPGRGVRGGQAGGGDGAHGTQRLGQDHPPRRPVGPVLEALAAKDILGGYDLGEDFQDLGNALLVCATETKTDADIDAYVEAMREIFSAAKA